MLAASAVERQRRGHITAQPEGLGRMLGHTQGCKPDTSTAYKYVPAKNEPKVWFESVRSMSQVLSEENRALLKLILETHPQSLVELAQLSGRAASNLSRTLKSMERYGLVHFEQGTNRQLAPRVNYSGVELEMSF